MSTFKEQINQIKEMLEDFQADIKPWLSSSIINEKKSQLESIEKTINALKRNETPIPDELRNLKFKLINELDLVQEAKEADLLLSEYLQSLLKPSSEVKHIKIVKPAPKAAIQSEDKQIANKKYNDHVLSKVTLFDLILSNLIPPNTLILKEYSKRIYKGIITENGEILMSERMSDVIFKDPSEAATQLIGESINGWNWWYVFLDAKWVLLDELRQKYLLQKESDQMNI
jgi:hypothetical protein